MACPNDLPGLVLYRCDAGPGRLDEQLVRVFADIEAEEVEALVDRDDSGLLLCQLQTALLEELRHHGSDFLFEQQP